MTPGRVFEWQITEWLGLTPSLSWLAVLLAAAACVAVAAWLYRDTLVALSPGQRVIFAALRCGILLTLLGCIAGPAWVERRYATDPNSRPIAVLVDRSASMASIDSRGETRLMSATHVWKKVEADAARTFPEIRYFWFDKTVHSASDLEHALAGSGPGDETRLYGALNGVMKDAPPGGYGAVVCLTDGLDTTQDSPQEWTARAVQGNSPVYFAVGRGNSSAPETLSWREIDVPGEVLANSRFTATAVLEAHVLHPRTASAGVWAGHTATKATFQLHAGTNVIPWTLSFDSGGPGAFNLDYSLASPGSLGEVRHATVNVARQEQTHILFYQGSVDWSCRFVMLALHGEPGFTVSGIFDPRLAVSQEFAAENAVLLRIPDDADELKPFQIVVLSNVVATQLSSSQQASLASYVKGGGGLLLVVPDDAAAATFSGTPLERSILPVVFDSPPKEQPANESVDEFKERMRTTFQVGVDSVPQESDVAARDSGPDLLRSFVIPPGSEGSEIANVFGAASGGVLTDLPKFSTYAKVQAVKAGAQILAVHPDQKSDSNVPRPLVVTQRFGNGYVTVLLTDSLWRWKMSLPSDNKAPLIFWQQLFHALARNDALHSSLRFAKKPYSASLGQLCHFEVVGAQGKGRPVVTFGAARGGLAMMPMMLDYDPERDCWPFDLAANRPGELEIMVRDGRGAMTETMLHVSAQPRQQELSGLPPDVDGLRALAGATGGGLLNDGTPGAWSASSAPEQGTLVSKRIEPAWDNWIVLVFCLGLYVTELVWRRQLKLL
jgi:uncharacterized membrane protein